MFGKNKSPKEENHVDPNGKKSSAGKFIGFVLLSENSWSKEKFFADMKSEWGIELENHTPDDDEMVYVGAEGFRIVIGLMPTAIPGGEAEYYAKANYMWKDAEKVVARHSAHLLVTVLGEGDMLDRARLYVKVTSSLLNQDTALALYSEGAVYQPVMYRECAGLMKDSSTKGSVPILNLVWFGLYGDGKMAGVYTYGMRHLGKEEIEVYVPASSADLNGIRNFLVSVAAYVIEDDVILRDGETIGFSAEQMLPIKVSPGLAVDGNTIKIDITKQ